MTEELELTSTADDSQKADSSGSILSRLPGWVLPLILVLLVIGLFVTTRVFPGARETLSDALCGRPDAPAIEGLLLVLMAFAVVVIAGLIAGLSRFNRASTINLKTIPWWAVAVVLVGITFVIVVIVNIKYQEAFSVMVCGRPTSSTIEGILLTVRITLASFGIAMVLGLVMGLARLSSNVVIFNLATFYVEVIRGVPLVVLMLYVAFVLLPLAIDFLGSVGTSLNIAFLANLSIRQVSFEVRAIAALAFGYGAYEAEVFRAGIQSIERGQMEAARSLGMTYFQAMRHIILPQAIRRVLPPLGNDFIAMLKDSSLATVLAVAELTQLSRVQRSSTFRVFEIFNTVTLLYLSMTLVLSGLVRVLERRMSGDRPTGSIR